MTNRLFHTNGEKGSIRAQAPREEDRPLSFVFVAFGPGKSVGPPMNGQDFLPIHKRGF
jgi:hypothetical protein